MNQVYYGVGWKRKFKAPTDFCFGVKHPQIQEQSIILYPQKVVYNTMREINILFIILLAVTPLASREGRVRLAKPPETIPRHL